MLQKDRPSLDVGSQLRRLRKQRRITLRSLARSSGLSANAVSMIERGLSSPSVSTLYKLAEALNIPITALFQAEMEPQRIVHLKSNQRRSVAFPLGVWEGLGGEAFIGRVEPFMLTLESGANSGQHTMVHTGHEFVLCLQGVLEYEVEGERYHLEPGDSLLFAARLQHRWRNPGPKKTHAVFVLSGFEEDERLSEYHFNPRAPEASG